MAQPLPQPRVDVLAQVVEEGGYDTVLFANSVLAADVAAGLAARLDAGLNWDLVDVELKDGELVGKRPALQDSVYADVGWTSTPRLALFRAGSFDATPTGGGEPEIADVSPSYAAHSTAVKLVGQDAEESSGPSIEDADVIVAGGRGLGSPENFTLAEELAKALGGAVGATRAVVDAGWYPYSAQIGQTGKTVSPKLYVALGISGAIQHKVGMQSSGTIVAINKDANAPIFEFSDLGVVGDVHEIVPKLTELVRARKAMSRPSNFPPPFSARDYIAEPTDPPDERIEVGVLIVGAGPAGLACAIRLGQLLEEHPEMAERFGEVPVAVLEKGKQPGSHLLSGAVVNPRALRRLFGDRFRMEDLPSYGPVHGESVYVLTRRSALPIPPPPPMRNHGNWIFSLSQLGRFLAEQAEEAGAMILPETAAQKLLVSHGRVVGVRTGDKGRNREGGELGNFEAGSDLVAKVTVLAEGTQGHLTGVALDRFDLRGDEPQVWELAVKEVWKVAKPLDRVIHTMGWPLRAGKRYREFGGSFIYPMGEDMVTIGLVVGLDYRDASLSVHDLLQELKTHPKIRKILAGGERVRVGREDDPERRLPLAAAGAARARPAPLRRRRRDGQRPAPQGHPLRDRVGTARGRGRVPRAAARRDAGERALVLRRRGARQLHLERPARGAEHAPGLRPRLLRRRRARERDDDVEGPRRAREDGRRSRTPTSRCSSPTATRATRRPTASSRSTSSRRSSPRATRRATTSRTTSGSSGACRARSRSSGRTCARRRCTRSERRTTTAPCMVDVAPSNCVQCGAITAKGGRLTPPEGGSGPEYTVT